MRFSRQHRLLTKADYDRVLRRPALRRQLGPCRLAAVPNQLNHARLGLIVAKRQVRLAVTRNRLKRVVRESFRAQCQQLPPLDLVIQLTAAPSNAELRGILSRLWQQLPVSAENSGAPC